MDLLIDDERTYHADIICRTAKAARQVLDTLQFDFVMFDHDLGCQDDNGYKILTWALENNKCPKKVQIITSSPVGKKNMEDALKSHGYSFNQTECQWEKF
jgi:response regulator of citrate/malate metabolism